MFISDLHLDVETPATTKAFLHFLAHDALAADALYILGDFFEVWLGDDDKTPFHRQITQALKHYTQTGIPTYFMHGNRDFLIGRRFARATGVKIIKDPTLIDLYGKPTLLMHGDSLCTLDERHQIMRKRMYNRWYQFGVLCLPLAIRRHYAAKIRANSKQRGKTLAENIMDVTPAEVGREMQRHTVTQLIHGHTHRPNIHNLMIDNQPAQRIVLGSWHDAGSVLTYQSDGSYSLHQIPFKDLVTT